MNPSPSGRHAGLVALVLSLALPHFSFADSLDPQALRDHIDAQVPAHLKIHSLSTRVLGNPAKKVKLELELEAAEALYAEVVREPVLRSVATELTADLRTDRPKALRLLRVSMREGDVTRRLNLDLAVNDGSPGPVAPQLFESFGHPRTHFPAEAMTEDSDLGRSALTAFDASVKDYNAAVAKLDKRAGTDRTLKNATGLLDKGLSVYDTVAGHGSDGTSPGPAEDLKDVLKALKSPPSTETNAPVPAPASAPALKNAKPAQFNPANPLAGALRRVR